MSDGAKEVGRIAIRVTPKTDRFRTELRKQLETIEKSMRGTVQVDAEVDAGGAKAHMREVLTRLQAQAKANPVKVGVAIDRSTLNRVRSTISDSLEKLSNARLAGIPLGPGLLGGALGLAALAGPALGLLSSALAALPGLITAVAVPVAALTLGLDGLKAAAASIAPQFEMLKGSMSIVVGQQFTPVFQQLSQLFPLLGRSLPKVSQGMADLARSAVDVLTSAPGMDRINTAIANVGAAISAAAPGVASFTDGLLTLATKFTSKLPGVAEWFNSLGESFSSWVTKITTVGPDGVSTFDKAMQGLGNTAKILMDTLGGLLSKGMDFMSDPARIEKFNTALQGLGSSLTSIVNDSTRFYDVMQNIKSVFTDFDFSAIWADLTQPFTSADAPWRSMWAGLQSAAQQAWASVTAITTAAVATITSVATSIGSRLSNIWSGITGAASAAWNGVTSAVQQAWQQISTAVSTGVDQAVSFVAAMPGKILAAVGNFGTLLVQSGQDLIQGLIKGIQSMVSNAVAAVKDVASQVVGAVKGALGIHSPSKVFAEIGQFSMQGLQNGLLAGKDAVLKTARDMAAEVGGALNPGDYAMKGLDIGKNFAMANASQFAQDLGFSGNGAVEAFANYGLQFGQNAASQVFNFQVSSVDDAMRVKQNETNRQALQYFKR